MRAVLLAFFFVFVAGTAAAAPIVVLDGEVRGIPDGIYAPVVDIHDDTGTTRTTLTLADVAVTDGLFEAELDLSAVAEQLAAGTEVTVDVELEGLSARARFGAIFSVGVATRADGAVSAASADSLGSIAAAELIQRDTVATAPLTIAFANLVGVPPGIRDGDDVGNIDSVGDGLAVTAGTLRVTSVTASQWIPGTVPTTALIDGSFTSANIAGLAAANVAANTLTGADFSTSAIGANDVAGTTATIFAQNIACDSVEGGITTASSCTRRLCASGAGRVSCGTSTCQQPSSGLGSCSNTPLGKLLFAP